MTQGRFDNVDSVRPARNDSTLDKVFSWGSEMPHICFMNKHVEICEEEFMTNEQCNHEECPWKCGACATYGGPTRTLFDAAGGTLFIKSAYSGDLVGKSYDEKLNPALLKHKKQPTNLLTQEVPLLWWGTRYAESGFCLVKDGGEGEGEGVFEACGIWSWRPVGYMWGFCIVEYCVKDIMTFLVFCVVQQHCRRDDLCTLPSGEEGEIWNKLRTAELTPAAKRLRVLCLVMTTHLTRFSRLEAQRRTWGTQCDGFIALSDVWDPEVPSMALAQEGTPYHPHTWQRSRAAWAWAAERHLEGYDYFVMSTDDSYLNVVNLKSYLAGFSPKQPHYFGRRLMEGKLPFNIGRASYVLSHEALRVLASRLDDSLTCDPHGNISRADVQISRCFAAVNIIPVDTQDTHGAERFHPVAPVLLPQINPAHWLYNRSKHFVPGHPGVSTESISFQGLKPDDMRRMHMTLHRCNQPDAEGSDPT